MMDLAAKDSYMQKFAKKVFFQQEQEPKKRPFGGKLPSNFSTVDVLRKRLHEKIEESRGQGTPKNALSEAVLAKRAKRKIERERKKRKRKEFILKKKLAEENSQEASVEIKKEPEPAPAANKRDVTALVFNKVETVEEEPTRKQDLDEALVNLIVKDTQSFSVVEDAVKAMVDAKYVLERNKAIADMQKVAAVSLTSDMWTSINMNAYLAVTCHFVADNTGKARKLVGYFRSSTLAK
ncbi:hypothetical protein JOQ06_008269, partial [Pogonophryne albipinna]